MRKPTLVVFGLALGLSLSTPAMACKFVMPKTAAERKAAADRTVKNATAIIEAKVITVETVNGVQVATLEAVKILKGPKGQKRFRVSSQTSCDRHFGSGYQGRVILFGGPKEYRAGMYPSDEADISAAIKRTTKR